jgi:molybdopterin-dependent oxidoreductase alpha subunit
MQSKDDPREATFDEYTNAAGGWGSVHALGTILRQEGVMLKGPPVLAKQNKPDGFACVSCSWAKPADPHAFEFCENGAKATAWEITAKRVDTAFFTQHTVAELEGWSDLELEAAGRLTAPLRYDPVTDKYQPVAWSDAFEAIAADLRNMDPESVVFYTSGRASLEASYLYQLMARMYGNNNLPDSSNMCHESTSVALPKSLGVPVGTVTLDDFQHTDCILFFGRNTGTNAPRMLHQLEEVRKRGVPIVTFNPLRERGLERFVNPQSPVEMLTPAHTDISTQYVQVKVGGDIAALTGMMKWIIEADDQARANGAERLLDTAFIAEHTHGLDDLAAAVRAARWEDIEQASGVGRDELTRAAQTYVKANAAMLMYGMGLTQHREGVQTIHMLTNLLLLRGNVGKPGAGICPIRGHSNVQGQRTVGITEKPEQIPADKLRQQYGFEPPTKKGLNTVEACEKVLARQISAFVMLGGNFVRAVPDHGRIEPAWRDIPLTVQIITKLNRSALIHGRKSFLLPCIGRIEFDRQASGEQAVSMEDSTGCMHGSRGQVEPASPDLLSEIAIVGELAMRLLPPNPKADWRGWIDDYATIRDAIGVTYPEIFHDFNQRMWTPGGFARPLGARQRKWDTPNGKANFFAPTCLDADPDMPAPGGDILRLMTTRSDNQFNTTIYGLSDRFRGVHGTRRVLLMNRGDIERLRLQEGAMVTAVTVTATPNDPSYRSVSELRVQAFDIPEGCVTGYYPELNPLVPLEHYAKESKVPAAKGVSIRLVPAPDSAA